MRVFLTGGTGSLGMALLRRFASSGVDVTVYSRDEVKQSEAKGQFPQFRYVLGDVRDEDWLRIVMRGHDIVVHAAAYKQVPAAEANVGEAIATNVLGSRAVARAAVATGVERVVGVSTDKACAPVNAYGMTKALMEKIFQEAHGWGHTEFICVRYGNVLGSRGSVVPLFVKQLKSGYKPVITLTDGRATRFWMTLDDAVDMVGDAIAGHAPITGGAVVVRHCPASTMVDLVKAVAEHCHMGAGDYTVREMGLRPGEKMHEMLVNESESLHAVMSTKGTIIYPPDSKYRGTPFTYTSDEPDKMLTPKLLLDMIERHAVVAS